VKGKGKERRTNEEEHPAPSRITSNSSHLEQTDGEEGGDEVGDVVDRPEEGETDGKFVLGVVVGEVEDAVGNEATLEEGDEESEGEEGGAAVHGELRHGEDGEDDELHGKPDVDLEEGKSQSRFEGRI
jgi:hypothetical protein